jgi:hypothetical protein
MAQCSAKPQVNGFHLDQNGAFSSGFLKAAWLTRHEKD